MIDGEEMDLPFTANTNDDGSCGEIIGELQFD